jgi:hypothetical protein
MKELIVGQVRVNPAMAEPSNGCIVEKKDFYYMSQTSLITPLSVAQEV